LTTVKHKRKILVVGPVVAADSESNLRTFRFIGTLGAATVGLDHSSPTLVGCHLGALPFAPASSQGALSESCTPAGLRQHLGPRHHRRVAPGLA
jgi:hypothetical protein